jgi:hypothetical protein
MSKTKKMDLNKTIYVKYVSFILFFRNNTPSSLFKKAIILQTSCGGERNQGKRKIE